MATSTSVTQDRLATIDRFRHEAFLYDTPAAFLNGVVPFISAGLDHSEPVMVAVSAEKIVWLRDALDVRGDQVQFVDMALAGHNPARIIPAWQRYLDEHGSSDQRVRGVGEPIWAGRTAAQLIECQRHESLLNVAFAGSRAWSLLCPYDTASLDPVVIEEAYRTHPVVGFGDEQMASPSFDCDWAPSSYLDEPLPEPARVLDEVAYGPEQLHVVRTVVATHAQRFGMGSTRTDELVVAVNEITTNTVRHGGGFGLFRLWREGRTLICEVRDPGRIDDPLAGRVAPSTDDEAGRGLWIANQLCDLLQIRVFGFGSVVRLHMAIND